MASTRAFVGDSIPIKENNQLLGWTYTVDSGGSAEENLLCKRGDAAAAGVIDVSGMESAVISIIGVGTTFTWDEAPKLRGSNNPLEPSPGPGDGVDLSSVRAVDGAFTVGPVGIGYEECIAVDCTEVPQYIYLTGGMPSGGTYGVAIGVRLVPRL